MHLNSKFNSNTHEYPSYKVLDSQFLNLEYGNKANYFLDLEDGGEAHTNEGNRDANIEALLFRDANYTSKDKDATEEGTPNNDCNHDVIFYHAFLQKVPINTNWIPLGTGSSIDVFSNPSLLTKIHKLARTMKIHCNAGLVHVTHMGTLPGQGLVWFNREGISNFISMANATNKYPVSYDR